MQAAKIQRPHRGRWLGLVGFGLGLLGYEIMLVRLIIMVVFFALVSYEVVRWLAYVSLDWSGFVERLRQPDRTWLASRLPDPRLEYLRDLHRRGDG